MTVREGRTLSFAEYGTPNGSPIVWMHGTPGASRQVPFDVRFHAAEAGLRIICIDRPGIGDSTPHLYHDLADWVPDLELLLDRLGIGETRMIGLSGGGPYVLAGGAMLPGRVAGVGVFGGVAPTKGPDAIGGGPIALAVMAEPILRRVRTPASKVLNGFIRGVRPIAGSFLDLYAIVQPNGDKTLLQNPEFKAMFVDDLLNGSRVQTAAPLTDLVLFSREWGFELADVKVPVRWWHGTGDHIVPFKHGQHSVERLPNATLTVVDGENHLAGLGIARSVIDEIAALGK